MARFSVRRSVLAHVVLTSVLGLTAMTGLVAPAGATTTPVSGTVTESGTGTPVADAWVTAVPTDPAAPSPHVPTDAEGNFEMDLPTGSYRFLIRSPHTIKHWYGGGEDTSSGTVLSVDGPTDVSAAVKPAGLIRGSYPASAIGPQLTSRRPDGSAADTISATFADGQWEGWVTTEQPVAVGLIATTPDAVLRTTRWLGGKYAAANSTPVQVDSGQTVDGLSLDLPEAAVVTGRTTNAAGTPIRVDVTPHVLEDGEWVPVGSAKSSASTTGLYERAVPAGEVVTFRATGFLGEGYEPTWLGNTVDETQADQLMPSAGETVPAPDLAVIGGTPVTGTVKDARGLPVAGVTVTIFRERSDVELGTTQTDALGRYEVPGLGWLSAGTVGARFTGEHLVTSWSGNQGTQATSQLFSESRTIASQTVAFKPGFQVQDPEAPTMTGTGLVGTSLEAVAGIADPTSTSQELRWYCGSTSLGVTGPSYLVGPADDGCSLHVRQVSLRDGWGSGMTASPSVTARHFALVGSPVVQGNRVVGQRLRTSGLAWSGTPDTVAHQWLRGGVPISRATASTYVPRVADVGKVVSVRVTGQRTADALTATQIVSGVNRIRARTTIRVVRIESRRGRAEITLRLTSPGATQPGKYIYVSRKESYGESSVRRLRVTGSPQTFRWTYRSHHRSNRLVFRYPGSANAAPARVTARVVVR